MKRIYRRPATGVVMTEMRTMLLAGSNEVYVDTGAPPEDQTTAESHIHIPDLWEDEDEEEDVLLF
jgi:hypothetical protein